MIHEGTIIWQGPKMVPKINQYDYKITLYNYKCMFIACFQLVSMPLKKCFKNIK